MQIIHLYDKIYYYIDKVGAYAFMKIVLASKSPRRRELLSLMGLDFTVITADIDESINPHCAIEDEVARLSYEKACAVSVAADDVVISADTVVVYGDEVMGKPENEQDAKRMLTLLSGNTHRVLSGITVKKGKKAISRTVTAFVSFRDLSEDEIERYIASGEPMDKAGAYGIQGKASVFVSRIEGDYFSIVGLPVCTLSEMLKEFGIKPKF